MKERMKELQKLKGVGEAVSRRLVEAGHDTFAKISTAGEEGLRKIQGLNPRMVQPILAQAGEMINSAQKSKSEKVAELKQRSQSLKMQVQEIALNIRERFKNEITVKMGRKLEKDIVKVVSSLKKVEGKLASKMKKAGKGLLRTEKRLALLAETKLKGVSKGLRRARKSLKRVYS